ncbi:MAG: hypothetical protein U5L46_15275 [Agrobacterium sp.]|nr:hypothetical protein [Agrobacterium sp.]
MAHQPELKPLQDLLAKSRHGVEFGRTIAAQCQLHFEAMANAAFPLRRLVGLLEILMIMLADKQAKLICDTRYAPQVIPDSASEKIDRIIGLHSSALHL